MTTDNLELTLDLDEINKKIEEETRCPAQLVKSEYEEVSFEGQAPKKRWVLEWERLDKATGFSLRSRHSMPDPSQDVAGRRRRSYYKQVVAFANIGIRGSKPEDFLGTKAWVEETIEQAGSRYEQTWWKPVKKYIEGESFDAEASNMVLPTLGEISVDTVESSYANDDSVMDKLLVLMNGKSHRQVLIAVNSDPVLSRNTDVTSGLEGGTLVQELKDGGYLTEENGKYKRIG